MRTEPITVLISAYNEAQRILPSLRVIDDYLPGLFPEYEILVIDDGSTDDTAARVRSFAREHTRIRVQRNDVNRGRGYSHRQGVRESSGEIILFTDADLSTPIQSLEHFLVVLDKGADIVIGSRRVPGACIEVRQPWYRACMGTVFQQMVRTIVISGFRDTQCGFKLIRGRAAKDLFRLGRIDRFCFDVEMLFLAGRSGLVVREVPVTWRNSPHSQVNILGDSLNMFLDLFRIRWYRLTGVYHNAERNEGTI
jgi:dolichyl-phosphate beta-glucosyltransferase